MPYFKGGVICDFSFVGRLNHHASLPVLLTMGCIAPGGLQGAGGFSSGHGLADFNDARPGSCEGSEEMESFHSRIVSFPCESHALSS